MFRDWLKRTRVATVFELLVMIFPMTSEVERLQTFRMLFATDSIFFLKFLTHQATADYVVIIFTHGVHLSVRHENKKMSYNANVKTKYSLQRTAP